MAEKSGDLEVDAVNDAFQAKIGDLFKTLDLGLIGGHEQEAVKLFTNGINLARRARELALDALKAGPEASVKTKGKSQKS
jgi:hypothetical protein